MNNRNFLVIGAVVISIAGLVVGIMLGSDKKPYNQTMAQESNGDIGKSMEAMRRELFAKDNALKEQEKMFRASMAQTTMAQPRPMNQQILPPGVQPPSPSSAAADKTGRYQMFVTSRTLGTGGSTVYDIFICDTTMGKVYAFEKNISFVTDSWMMVTAVPQIIPVKEEVKQ